MIIVIECKRCGTNHKYKPGKSLLCCSRPKGVTLLVVRVQEPETGAKWCTITNQAKVVRFITDSDMAKHGLPWKDK